MSRIFGCLQNGLLRVMSISYLTATVDSAMELIQPRDTWQLILLLCHRTIRALFNFSISDSGCSSSQISGP